jgi:hypothetical protein
MRVLQARPTSFLFIMENALCGVCDSDAASNALTHIGFKVTCTGNPGHGSRFIKATAVEKLVFLLPYVLCCFIFQLRLIETLMKIRDENEAKLEAV